MKPLARPRRVEVLERREVWKGFFRAEVLRLRHERFSGDQIECERERWIQRRAVTVLPYDPVADTVLLIEQFRAGAMEQSEGAWIIEAIAGMIDADDTGPDEAARREAKEEAGLDLERLEHVGAFLSSPGCTTERVEVFIGLTDLSAAGGIHGLEDEVEDILNHVLPFPDAMAHLDAGHVLGISAVVALQALALRRNTYRAAAGIGPEPLAL